MNISGKRRLGMGKELISEASGNDFFEIENLLGLLMVPLMCKLDS